MKNAVATLAAGLIAFAPPAVEAQAPIEAARPSQTEPSSPVPASEATPPAPGPSPATEATPPAPAPSPATDAPAAMPEWPAAAAPAMQPGWDLPQSAAATVTFPWLEHHGYYRVRLNLFHNFDLDTFDVERGRIYTSPFAPPLTETDQGGSGHSLEENPDSPHSYKRGADTLASANMRLRWQPTIHISETLRIKATVDALDNLVLGSTPDGGIWGQQMDRPDVALPTFSGGQVPPASGVNSYQDSVRIKSAWGEWKTPVGQVLFGRVPSEWGMGILANGGNCLDCNFGDAVDRIMGVTQLFGTYMALGWDFVNEGPIGLPGIHDLNNQPSGQPYDLENRDDVNEYVIALFQRPVTKKEKAERDRTLNELRKPTFDWGVYNVIRSQEFTAEVQAAGTPVTDPSPDAESIKLRDIKAFAFIPDAWMKFEYRPKRGHFFKGQLEFAYIYGAIEELPQRFGRPIDDCLDTSIDNIDDCPADQIYHPRKRDIRQWGYALELDHRMEKLQWGFHHGVASGDKTDGFGVLDRKPIDPSDNTDQEITNFKFDRDYVVDLILFRQLIGAVTNAAYFKPYIQYDLIADEAEAWGFKLSAMYAFALEEKATPGDESPLGLEFDLGLYVHEFDRFRWGIDYGLLLPFGAFNLKNKDSPTEPLQVVREPGVAQTLQMSVGMQF